MSKPPPAKLFLEGRYRKLSRDLPQTIFYCPECKGHPRRRKNCERCEGYGKITRDSVQELVAWVVAKAFGTRKHKFHGAGREDVDVRMLGRGRPFVLELIGPKVFDLDLAELEAEVNRRNEDRLEIKGLHYADKARVATIKETHHAKRYAAVIECEAAVERAAFDPLIGGRRTVVQRTPKRVAHRRADLDRERWIEITSVEPCEDGDDRRFRIELETEHGTYVKEVLSGEHGATRPSLSELVGTPCRCVELDVLEILDSQGGEEQVFERPKPFGAGL